MAKIENEKLTTAREKSLNELLCEFGVMCGEDEEKREKVLDAVLAYAEEDHEDKNGEKVWTYTMPRIKKAIIKKFFTEETPKSKKEKYLEMMKAAAAEDKEKKEKKAKKAKE